MTHTTPWGESLNPRAIAPGIVFHETPSHGGYYLDATRRAQVPAEIVPFTGDRAWWEEDCDWAVVALVFPDEFTREHDNPLEVLQHACEIVRRYHPEWLSLLKRT